MLSVCGYIYVEVSEYTVRRVVIGLIIYTRSSSGHLVLTVNHEGTRSNRGEQLVSRSLVAVTVNDSKSGLAATAEQPVNTSLQRHVATLCDGEPGTC